ncbi:hypothetical protein AX14_011280 [Amanita brunnescens Koide BX004]|nr:hypothetical protein AX14_011280 [Amanita brunnescens Koide BX004]
MVDYKYYIQSALTQGYIESDVAKDGSKVKVDDDAQILLLDHEISDDQTTVAVIKASGKHMPALYVNPPTPGSDDLKWGTYKQRWIVVPEGTHYNIYYSPKFGNHGAAENAEEDKLWAQKDGTQYVPLLHKWLVPVPERKWNIIPAD